MNRLNLLGIEFDAVTRHEALELLLERVRLGKEKQLPAQLAVTVNVQILVNARSHYPELLPIINEAPIVITDGAPLVFLSKIFPPRIPERIAGSDFIYDIAEGASKNGLRVYFFGGNEEDNLKAIDVLKAKNPELIIAGHDSPFVQLAPNADQAAEEIEMCRKISDAKTDVLIVGLGNPKQEFFVHRNAEHLKGLVAIGLGGTFNFLSNRTRRAPKWIQNIGCEWLFRISQEPRRLFMRYFMDAFHLAAYILAEPFRRWKKQGR